MRDCVMPRVLIRPHYQYENELEKFLEQANVIQTDFKFHLLPPENKQAKSPFNKDCVDYLEALSFLDTQKQHLSLNGDDLLISFYDGTLTALDRGLSNLFIAGASAEDLYPYTAVVSLKFISWGILENKYDYALQRHALFHLVMCCLIGAYTKLTPHSETYGCLLDFNNELVSFNRALQMGYYLCSERQGGCYDAIKSEVYGSSIIELCRSLKNGIDHKKLQVVIQELVMANSIHQYGDGDNIAGDKVMGDKIETQINNSQDLVQASKDIRSLLAQLSQDYPQDSPRVLGAKALDTLDRDSGLKDRILRGVRAGSFSALEKMIDHPVAKFFIEGTKEILKP